LNDAAKIRELAGGSVLSFLMDTATLAGGLAIIWVFSWKLALLSCCVVPPMCLLVLAVNRPLRRTQREALESIAAVQSNLVENITGCSTIKTLGAEEHAAARAETAVHRLIKNLFRANSIGSVSNSAAEVIIGIGITAILWVASRMTMQNELSVGKLVSFYTILSATVQPLLRSVMINHTVQDGLVAARRLGEVMDIPAEQTCTNPLSLPADAPCEISFQEVSFRYGCRSRTLTDIEFRIPPRSMVGIVGESGSGKSTLARLLLRQFDPEHGVIKIDGCDVRALDLQSLRRRVGMVEQEAFVFAGTIAENLVFGMESVSGEQVLAALRAVNLESWIASLPDGINTQIGERGTSISAGQRQRLAIARMLLRNPNVLILDEATSNLDARTEEIIQDALAQLRGRKTIVLIAHRLSTVCRADLILVLHQGRVVESGSHLQLLERRGRYFELWRAQMHHAMEPLEQVA
jgi:ATP-binding cassette subfamily B protein